VRTWTGVVCVEEELSGDGRLIAEGAAEWDDGPWPLKFSLSTTSHDEATIIGTIRSLVRDGRRILAEGVIDDDSSSETVREAALRAIELIEAGTVGVSVESSHTEISEERSDDETVVFRRLRIRAAALVDIPALEGTWVGMAAALRLLADSRRYDPEWFTNPAFGADGNEDVRLVWQSAERPEESPGQWGCPLTVEDNGRIFGHAALRHRCHGSYLDQCLVPPAQDEALDRWLIGEAVAGVRTGPIWAGGSHGVTPDGRVKDPEWLAKTSEAVADVTAGWDQHGLWVAGAVRPGVTATGLAALRGSALSAEWHSYGGKLRCVGVLAVNGPGYLVRRAVAASGGVLTAGADCAGCQISPDDRLNRLERAVALLLRQRTLK